MPSWSRVWSAGIAATIALTMGVLAAACGTSTSPSQSSVLGISIARNVLIVQETATLSTTLHLTNGQATVVTPAWSLDAPNVATISPMGVLVAIAPGTAAITASYQGQIAKQSVRVVPDYRGNWAGSVRISACSCSSACIPCGCRFELGQIFAITLTAAQVGDQVNGNFVWDGWGGPANGSVSGDNSLQLRAALLTQPTFVATEALTDWRTTTDSATGMMVGSFTIVNNTTAPGQCSVTDQNDIQVLKRTSQ